MLWCSTHVCLYSSFLTFPRLKFEKYDSSDHFPNTNSFLIMTQIKYIKCTAISFQSSYLYSIEIHHKGKSNQRKILKKGAGSA